MVLNKEYISSWLLSFEEVVDIRSPSVVAGENGEKESRPDLF